MVLAGPTRRKARAVWVNRSESQNRGRRVGAHQGQARHRRLTAGTARYPHLAAPVPPPPSGGGASLLVGRNALEKAKRGVAQQRNGEHRCEGRPQRQGSRYSGRPAPSSFRGAARPLIQSQYRVDAARGMGPTTLRAIWWSHAVTKTAATRCILRQSSRTAPRSSIWGC